MPGALCVMTSGVLLMPVWFADSWDSPDTVSVYSAIVHSYVVLYACTKNDIIDRKYINDNSFKFKNYNSIGNAYNFMIIHFN